MFKRQQYTILLDRIKEPRRHIQIIAGPRQVGKTTMVQQVLEDLALPAVYASFDKPNLRSANGLEQQWEAARFKCQSNEAILVLDEVQKIPNWSDHVKALWDEDTRSQCNLKIVLLGSSPLLIQKGLTESLAGRFELIRMPHWSFAEMEAAFGWDSAQYIFYGGYPGSAPLVSDSERWANYILDSIIETTISRDVLLMTRVDKPSLLRQVFLLGCDYSGQILSFQKMLGQLQDAGNTTTISHYLNLLAGAGMLTGIAKFSGKRLRQRASSPKVNVLNTALMSVICNLNFDTARKNPDLWGRLVESAVGAYLLNSAAGTPMEVFYWNDGCREVDFVLRSGQEIIGIEVKSGRRKESIPGMELLAKSYDLKRRLLVGTGGIPIEDFLKTPISYWFR
jgi:uncharacterized protein